MIAFRLSEESSFPWNSEDPEIRRWVQILQEGSVAQRKAALRKLIKARAESALARCMKLSDPIAASMATSGLWECWLNEKGPRARARMSRAIALMDAGDLAAAEAIFLDLMAQHPDWAEAANKQATLLYLRGQPAVSMMLCKKVLTMKPHHFGAWHGLALCAVQLGDWATALDAASRSLRLQPTASASATIAGLAKSKLAAD